MDFILTIEVLSLTFPRPDETQGAPFAPLGVGVHLVAGSDLNLVEVTGQGVKYHHGTVLGENLKDGDGE
ncbi:hypothetical protein EYF80_010847 [Liparis tanakae]|uniref:Uncharacterized protein n=1 Tax=Liparis tanakae TaxID=230148 RepID=A0A4Z2IMB3_9TELE|nr:hypothetical protein EYF80_010847 [Liparis tanakae]